MTREEAIEILQEKHDECKAFYDLAAHPEDTYPSTTKYLYSLDMAIAALRSPTREQVEKVWRGKWALVPNGVGGKQYMCSKCGGSEYEYWRRHFAHGNENFCPHCGAPMTDEAVEMVMERMEALNEA